MKLYHSSNKFIVQPDISYSRNYLDFGKGFYLTSIEEQAIRYGSRFIRREEEAWINIYELEVEDKDWRILKFNSYDLQWLDFITRCRAGIDNTDYDMIIGGVANDKVIRTIEKYFSGEMSAETAIGLLRFEKPNIQYCIRNQEMLNQCLKHINSKKL